MKDSASTRHAAPATAGAVAAAVLVVLSSACCIGPLAVVLSFAGLGTSALLAVENVLGPFRPVILGLTFVALGAGFYAAYRRTPCADGRTCARPHARRLQRVLLWAAVILLVVLLYFTYVHPNLDVLFDVYA